MGDTRGAHGGHMGDTRGARGGHMEDTRGARRGHTEGTPGGTRGARKCLFSCALFQFCMTQCSRDQLPNNVNGRNTTQLCTPK